MAGAGPRGAKEFELLLFRILRISVSVAQVMAETASSLPPSHHGSGPITRRRICCCQFNIRGLRPLTGQVTGL